MRQRGFTLVEVMVTISVLALILFIAMPSVGTWLDNNRIRNATESLQSGLMAARGEAVRRNQTMSLYLVSLTNPGVMDDTCTLSSDSGSWVISVNSPEKKCSTAPSTTESPMIADSRALGDGGGGVKVSASGNTVTFNGFGRITNTDAIKKIDITGPREGGTYRNLRLLITPAGSVRMCDPSVPSTATTDPRLCPAEPT